MGYEPTTLRDLFGASVVRDLFGASEYTGGSWVQIPSGARIFPSSQWVPSAISFHIIISFSHLHLFGLRIRVPSTVCRVITSLEEESVVTFKGVHYNFCFFSLFHQIYLRKLSLIAVEYK